MITKYTQGNILNSNHKTIILGTNTEGYNDAGLAGLIAKTYWPELDDHKQRPLGEIRTHITQDRTYHAIVCHNWEPDGWKYAPQILLETLDQIAQTNTEEMGSILIGSGLGLLQGVPLAGIQQALDMTKAKLEIFYL